MVKSKIKKNPYAQYFQIQFEMIEQQRQYWLKHPEIFIRDLIYFTVDARNNLSIEDKIRLQEALEKG